MKHMPILDGIRAYAVLMVCVAHFFQVDESALYEANVYVGIFLFKISQLGLRGVDLFFLLSGFLITNILLDTKNSPKYFSSFIARRSLRIFPLYYFILIVSFLLLPKFVVVYNAGEDIIHNQLWLWTYTSNLSFYFGIPQTVWDGSDNFPHFGHFWSLCVEEHFYILWPSIVLFSGKYWLSRIMWMFVGLSSSCVIIAYTTSDLYPLLSWSTIKYSGVLSLGGLIALYWREPEKFSRFEKLAGNIIVLSGFIFLLSNFIPRQFEFRQIPEFFSCNIFFSCIIIISLKGNKITSLLFQQKSLIYVGSISYGIYVYHGWLRPYLKSIFYDDVLVHIGNGILAAILYTVVCTAISIFIAMISWTVLEQPILQIKNKFKY